MAGNTGSSFAAAAMTLDYAHKGSVTATYARSAFQSYQSQLQNVDQQLSARAGAPDNRTIQELLKLYQPAMQAINHPCLEAACHWQAQITALNQASQAFLKAGE
ncbi:hypothetical protein KDI_38630 [Dictyobacter arantiisoli]|uniref:Uncharacterized protein n=2 Tax=Dictyobacter arantiisoli TaxID=2014874 RepID=A0A5A5TGZ5_9CHLR|nr:hypothetical protein KDI_38630 [Dictyobacter arantiisoli]